MRLPAAHRDRAFTLIELLVVILIIGILIAVAAPSFLGQASKAQNSVVQQQLTVVRKEAKAIWITNSQAYPSTLGGANSTDPTTLIGQLYASEPQYAFNPYTAASPSGPGVIDVAYNSPNSLTACEQSKSGTYFCLMTSEFSQATVLASSPSTLDSLFGVGVANAAATTDVVYTTGCSEANAITALTNGSGGGVSIAWGSPVSCSAPGTVSPSATVLPAVAGSAEVGFTLTGTPGTFPVTVSNPGYQWEDCNVTGTSCQPATGTGATTTSYQVAASDVGNTLELWESGSNVATAQSQPTATVPVPPTNTVLPLISGTYTAGQAATTTNGTWTGSGITYTYQWQRCNSANLSCTNLSGNGASTASYVVQAADSGSELQVIVTATGSTGISTVTSSPVTVTSCTGYGTGAAGAVVLNGTNTIANATYSSGTYTLTGDICATTFTNYNGTSYNINTNGWRIVASTSITIQGGTISDNGTSVSGPYQGAFTTPNQSQGGAGAAGLTSSNGAANGTWTGTGSVGGGYTGANGVSTGAGVTAGPSSGATVALGGKGGSGATSSPSGHAGGGVVGTWSGPATGSPALANTNDVLGGGGGSSGGGGTANPAYGGGGGGGAGVIVLVAPTVTFTSSPTVNAIGGSGGSCFLGGAGNEGNGGGGGGGALLVIDNAGAATGSYTSSFAGGAAAGGCQSSGQSGGSAGSAFAAAAATVTSASPSTVAHGSTQTITITGTGFASEAAVSFSNPGITVNSVTYNSATSLSANITVASGASHGATNVIVTNVSGQGTGAGALTVN